MMGYKNTYEKLTMSELATYTYKNIYKELKNERSFPRCPYCEKELEDSMVYIKNALVYCNKIHAVLAAFKKAQ